MSVRLHTVTGLEWHGGAAMRRWLVGLTVGCAALAFALVVAWLARDRDGEDWFDLRLE